jgi:hypothetical protein
MTEDARLLTTDLYSHFKRFATTADDHLLIVAPFIRLSALQAILQNVSIPHVVVVSTWRTEDVLRGASDTEIYPFLRTRGWALKLHSRLHAKLIIADLRRAIVSSANVTEPGLGLVQRPNLECATDVDLTIADQRWVLNLVFQSPKVNDAYYSAFKNHLASLPTSHSRPIPEFYPTTLEDYAGAHSDQLPISDSPAWLVSRLVSLRKFGVSSLDHDTLRQVLHDISLFSLSVESSPEEHSRILRDKFFGLPTIVRLQGFLHSERYFGEIKNWMRDHWIDELPPSRSKLTRSVQVVMAWLVELSDGKYVLKRPRHSQCLVPSSERAVAVSP